MASGPIDNWGIAGARKTALLIFRSFGGANPTAPIATGISWRHIQTLYFVEKLNRTAAPAGPGPTLAELYTDEAHDA